MRSQLLVTAVGEDRPGIVARLSEVFVKHGANVEESRMSILGGEFAAIILTSLPAENLANLKSALEQLESETIHVTTKDTRALHPDRFQDHEVLNLTVNGADHEGIVHKVSHYLSQCAVNIHSMETGITPAPETGSPLFTMAAVIFKPASISVSQLQANLKHIADQENVDICVTKANQDELKVLAKVFG
ncbi:MAG TPA: ACT domain-containing protein [Chroococcales cyanobacterium]